MSELSMSTPKKHGSYLPLLFIFLSCFLVSDLTYFLPYFLNLLHFLSPLLFTTFIVFLFIPYNTTFIKNPLPEPNNAGEHNTLEEHEVYKIFFEAASQFELLQQDDDTDTTDLESQKLVDKFLICVNDPTQDRNPPPENDEEFFQEKHDHHQSCDVVSAEKLDQVKEIVTDNSRIVVLQESKEEESEVKDVVVSSDKECGSTRLLLLQLQLQEKSSSSNKVVEYEKMMSMRSYGSMRVEKEWKRTLACKLFEERHNNNINTAGNDDEEGMDLLWEAYEENTNNTTFSAKHDNNKKTKKNKLEKKKSIGSAKSLSYKDMDAVEDDEEEEVIGSGKICCLQALKFSAGKVNMGMGRPNIGRISKAFRGIGWLHHVTTKKPSSSPRH